jgi:hypothetical protein
MDYGMAGSVASAFHSSFSPVFLARGIGETTVQRLESLPGVGALASIAKIPYPRSTCKRTTDATLHRDTGLPTSSTCL